MQETQELPAEEATNGWGSPDLLDLEPQAESADTAVDSTPAPEAETVDAEPAKPQADLLEPQSVATVSDHQQDDSFLTPAPEAEQNQESQPFAQPQTAEETQAAPVGTQAEQVPEEAQAPSVDSQVDSAKEAADDTAEAAFTQPADANAEPAEAPQTRTDAPREGAAAEEDVAEAAADVDQQTSGDDPDGPPVTLEDDPVEYYRRKIMAVYREHNPSKMGEVDGIMAKYVGKERNLYEAVCKKYMGAPPADSTSASAASARMQGKPAEGAANGGASAWGGGFTSSWGAGIGGLGALQAMKSAAEGIQQQADSIKAKVEKSFDEALQNREDESPPEPAPKTTVDDNGSNSAGGFLSSGMSTFQKMQGAAQSLSEKVNASFDEAIRTEEDISTADMLQKVVSAAPVPLPELSNESPSVVQEAEQGYSTSSTPAAIEEVPASTPASASTSKPEATTPAPAPAPAPPAPQTNLATESLLRERESLSRELKRLKTERQSLIDEGIKMSRRVATVEEKMKEVLMENRRADSRCSDLERAKKDLETKLAKLSGRAASAEALADEQRGDLRRLSTELDRARAQMEKEQKAHTAELEAREQSVASVDSRTKILQDKLEAAARERAELIATNQAISAEHQSTLSALDAAEEQLQHQQMHNARAMEQQQKRLEQVEIEFAQSSLPYTRQIAALEQRLAKQEQQMVEREAKADRSLAAVQAQEDALRKEVEQKAERDLHSQQEEAQRRTASQAEVEQFQKETAAARAALQVAERERQASELKREDLESQLRLEMSRRRSEEKRSVDLMDKNSELTQQIQQLRTVAVTSASASAAGGPPSLVPAVSSSAPSANGPVAAGVPRELEEDSRRLRAEIQALTRQRDALEKEAANLQDQVDSSGQKKAPAGPKAGAPSSLLEQKFEAALQMVGRLAEELEACKAERDTLKSQLGGT